jgi:hypothetical protein
MPRLQARESSLTELNKTPLLSRGHAVDIFTSRMADSVYTCVCALSLSLSLSLVPTVGFLGSSTFCVLESGNKLRDKKEQIGWKTHTVFFLYLISNTCQLIGLCLSPLCIKLPIYNVDDLIYSAITKKLLFTRYLSRVGAYYRGDCVNT